jgi:uncharacterized Zn-binding protein involved in type VI secretion
LSVPVIVVGDRTDHGGFVIQGSPSSDHMGKPIARVGDKVTCPKHGHGGTTTIVTGDPTNIIDGAAIARHGDKTACGATLISSQATAVVGGGGGSTSNASSSNAGSESGSRSVAEASSGGSAGTAGNAGNTALPVDNPNYDEQVKLAGAAGLPYYIESPVGNYSGRLDESELLPRIATAGPGQYTVYWGDEALEKIT